MTRTVFVTGGAGYVGAPCCEAFTETGWNVIVYDNLSRGWRDFVRWGPLIEGDILDAERLTSAMRCHRLHQSSRRIVEAIQSQVGSSAGKRGVHPGYGQPALGVVVS
jgi:UDP-glucose 4-epimerase